MPKPETITPEIHAQLRHISAEKGQSLGRFPDFLVAGPPRTGGTWLFSHLFGHPEVFLPEGKEVYFFTTLGQPEHTHFRYESLDAYLSGAMTDTAVRLLRKQAACISKAGRLYNPRLLGDPTASYATLDPEVIQEITLLNPDIKTIIVLRDPLDRAWSHAKKDLIDRHDRKPEDVPPEDYDKFFRASGQMKNNQYSEILANWQAKLKPGHLFAGEFRLVKDDPKTFVTQVLKFLGTKHNDWLIDSPALNTPVNATKKSALPDSVREMLTTRYADITDEYVTTIESLADHRVADGCYVL